MFAEAKPIYEQLGGDPAVSIITIHTHSGLILLCKTSSVYILMRTAACLRNIDELQEAAEVYEHSKGS
jgi:general transcription factor 3C polypeptide 3 (transcription factor C subunit 4)